MIVCEYTSYTHPIINHKIKKNIPARPLKGVRNKSPDRIGVTEYQWLGLMLGDSWLSMSDEGDAHLWEKGLVGLRTSE